MSSALPIDKKGKKSGVLRRCLTACIAVVALCGVLERHAQAQNGATGADGLTFDVRKQQWLSSVPVPDSSMDNEERRNYLFAWLDKGIYDNIVSETIRYLAGEYWYDGIRAQAGYLMLVLLKYGDLGENLISDSDETVIKQRIVKSIEESDFFSHVNPNKQMYAMVGTYLYTEFFDKSIEFPKYGHPVTQQAVPSFLRDTWPDFSYNGHSYTFGAGPYNANQLARDWLMWAMETWYVDSQGSGPREFDSIDYSRAFPGATALLWALAPSADQELIRRAKMATDLMLVDFILDFSANSLGGTLGRADFKWTARSPIFPTHVYWGMGEDVARFDIHALYQVGYVPPQVIIDIGVLADEPDDYWHFHKEHNGNWLLNNPDFGKWNWVTKHYNMGSNVGAAKQGWQVNVVGNGRREFIRFWINEDASEPPITQEASYLGTNGRQFRNALFVDLGSTPYLHEKEVRTTWDIEESQDGWRFKKLRKSMVAIRLGTTTASVELAIEGVDYNSWTEFKNAIRNRALLTQDFYRTSKEVEIRKSDYCGLNHPGDTSFPFPRMETIDHRGRMITRWENNILTVSRDGVSLIYNFNNWTFRSSGEVSDQEAPSPPHGVTVE